MGRKKYVDRFNEYYENWKKQTQFLYDGHFDNEWYKKIIDEVAPLDIMRHVIEILKKRNDYIAYALNDTLMKHYNTKLVKSDEKENLYVPLDEFCNKTRQAITDLFAGKIVINGLNNGK